MSRRWCLLVGLAAFLAGSLGVGPSPGYLVKTFSRVVGEPYPCMDGRCGCRSARECWTNCQCQTLAEKHVWARRVGVNPPPYAAPAPTPIFARVHVAASPEPTPEAPACSLCAVTKKSKNNQHNDPPGPISDPPGDHAPSGAPTLTALGCKGLSMLVAATISLAAPLERAMLSLLNLDPLFIVRPAPTPAVGSRALDVPCPPPRRARDRRSGCC